MAVGQLLGRLWQPKTGSKGRGLGQQVYKRSLAMRGIAERMQVPHHMPPGAAMASLHPPSASRDGIEAWQHGQLCKAG